MTASGLGIGRSSASSKDGGMELENYRNELIALTDLTREEKKKKKK